jgi:hypothetical protein
LNGSLKKRKCDTLICILVIDVGTMGNICWLFTYNLSHRGTLCLSVSKYVLHIVTIPFCLPLSFSSSLLSLCCCILTHSSASQIWISGTREREQRCERDRGGMWGRLHCMTWTEGVARATRRKAGKLAVCFIYND